MITPFKCLRSSTSLAGVKFVLISFCLAFELSLPFVGYSPISGSYKDKEEAGAGQNGAVHAWKIEMTLTCKRKIAA